MTCDYCGEKAELEPGEDEIEMHRMTGGDETIDLCESCYQHFVE